MGRHGLDKMPKNCMKITKLSFLGRSSGSTQGKLANALGSGEIHPSPPNKYKWNNNWGLATEPNVLKKCIFEKNQILLICSAGLWDWTLVQGSLWPLGFISKFKVWLRSGERDCSLFKACVHYFYQFFIFLSNDRRSKTMKNVFYFI